MNIIFLDIDGVIIPFGKYDHLNIRGVLENPYDYLSELASVVDRNIVGDLIKEANERDATFVLISTWRHLFSEDFLSDFLFEIGLGMEYFHKDWIAKSENGKHIPKNVDMDRWLKDHPSTKNWLMIDDESRFYVDNPVNAISPDPKVGFVRD